MKNFQKYLWLFLLYAFSSYGKEGWVVVFDRIEGLEILSHSVETTKEGEDWLVVNGSFKNPGWTLSLEGSDVAVSPHGDFTVKSKFSGAKHSLRFLAKNSQGGEQVENLNFTEGEKKAEIPLPLHVAYSRLGVGFYRYRQDGFIEQSTSDIAITLGAIRRLPNKLELGIEGSFNFLNLSNGSGFGVGYRDVSIHADYPFPFVVAKRPLRLLVGLQIIYSTMSVTSDAFGYQHVTGEGPKVAAEMSITNKIYIETVLSFLLLNRSFGFSSHSLRAEVGAAYQVTSSQSVGLNISYLNLQGSSPDYVRHSTVLNCLYRIAF